MAELSAQRRDGTALFKAQGAYFASLFSNSDDGERNIRPVRNLNEYIKWMSVPAADGGLWGDCVCCLFLEEHLKCKIWVWSPVMRTYRKDFNRFPHGQEYHVLYDGDAKHYEPLE